MSDDDDENDSKVDGVNGRFANESLLHDVITECMSTLDDSRDFLFFIVKQDLESYEINEHMIKWKFVDDQQLPGNVNGRKKRTHLTNNNSSSSSICASGEVMMITCDWLVHWKNHDDDDDDDDNDSGDGDGDGDKCYYIFLFVVALTNSLWCYIEC
uniref:Uncharacterized protein n=1 Tax=Glossina brevipalpis TaxID=37001 RepID=A0A1A9VZC1_9MUSC